ncbi:MAG: permease [Spirochaetota bacterium]
MDTAFMYVAAALGLAVSFVKSRDKTKAALKKAFKAFEGILPQFLVVLVLVAITLSVLDTATVSRFLGAESGALGVLIASAVGAITLIPGFVAFPAAAALLEGGAGATQIAAFVSSLMMVGVVTLPMETKYFGRKAAVMRNLLAFGFSLVAALFVGWVVGL